MGSINCEGTSVSQSYSNQIIRMVWYCKREAHMSQKFAFGLAQDKSWGMAMHRDVRVHSLRYTGKTNTPPQTQRSPSVHACVETFHFGRGLHKEICCHVFCGAVDKRDNTFTDDLPDEVVSNVNVFGTSVVVVIVSKLDGSLVIAEDGGWRSWKGKKLVNESVKPLLPLPCAWLQHIQPLL